MEGKLLAQFFLIFLETANALNCHSCEVANPYEGCIWGGGMCSAGPNGTCQTRIATFGPLFFLTWLGCAHQSHSCNKSGLRDSFFGFSYRIKCCDTEDLCNRIPLLEHRWPWNADHHRVLPNSAGILRVVLCWMYMI